MTDDFDDDASDAWPAGATPVVHSRSQQSAHENAGPRLVARLYASADQSLQARMLTCLMRPLGPLGLVAVASGAFASFFARAAPPSAALEEAAQFTRDQIVELARFAEQVNPEVLQQFVGLFGDGPLGMATISAAALALLVRSLQRSRAPAAEGLLDPSMKERSGEILTRDDAPGR
jgi:hypothetical protein